MIRINLTPFEELDNPRWWIPDVAVLALVVALTFGGVYFYIDSVEQQIAAKIAEKDNMAVETANLQGEVSKFNDLNSKIATLDNRKNALKRITESKLIRYLPVILLENIQNLKPDKVWLTGLAFVDKKKEEAAAAPAPAPVQTDGSTPQPAAVAQAPAPVKKDIEFPVTIEITGTAVDNIAISEFMLSLKATQNQSFEKSDLRTQLFFSDVGIVFSAISTDKGATDDGPESVNIKLLLNFKEKLGSVQEGKFSQFIDQFNKTGRASVN
jgi:Tfp pilus assembly protein PilN